MQISVTVTCNKRWGRSAFILPCIACMAGCLA